MKAPEQRNYRHTKILATIGPASAPPEVLAQLVDAGVAGFRLNFSHGDHATHKKNVENIRKIAAEKGVHIAILQDLQGPKIRIGEIAAEKGVVLERGQVFTLDSTSAAGDGTRAHLPHPEILEVLEVGDPVYINDGVVRMRVSEKHKDHIVCKVEAGGTISSRKGLNLPGVDLPFSALTEKDKEDAVFGQTLDVDWVALSFVQRPEDIVELRTLIGNKTRIMAKIEMPNAVKRIDSIIEVSDGIMVARGDLGVELPLEEVPSVQKKLVRHCREKGKIVVVATQMLESMTQNNTPTRAEVSDVANATYEGADTLMLSAETASGKYPVEAVEVMARIISRVEQSTAWKPLMDARNAGSAESVGDGITYGAYQIAESLGTACIVTFTTSGSTALRMSRQRPLMPILMLTTNAETARALNLGWGLQPQLSEVIGTFEDLEPIAEHAVQTSRLGQKGDHVLLTAGVPFGVSGSTNMVRVFTLK